MIRTAYGRPIEFVSKIEARKNNEEGERVEVKAGLVITNETKHRGIGIEEFSFYGSEKDYFIYFKINEYSEKIFLYVKKEEIEKIKNDPTYKKLKKKYYGVE
jgi:hypothetical protein